MNRLRVAVMLAGCAAFVQIQSTLAAAPIQPNVDTAEQRQALRAFTNCLAESRPTWARQTLAQPYLSEAQARSAGEALSGRDKCLREGEVEMTFRTSSVVGNLAEHFLRVDLSKTDPDRLARTLNTLTPLNGSEDFALCVASRAPSAARDLALSEIGGSDELQAAERLFPNIAICTRAGEHLTVDLQALRALMSIALYRAITSGPVART